MLIIFADVDAAVADAFARYATPCLMPLQRLRASVTRVFAAYIHVDAARCCSMPPTRHAWHVVMSPFTRQLAAAYADMQANAAARHASMMRYLRRYWRAAAMSAYT